MRAQCTRMFFNLRHKLLNGRIEGDTLRAQRIEFPCACRKSNSRILVVQAAENRAAFDAPN